MIVQDFFYILNISLMSLNIMACLLYYNCCILKIEIRMKKIIINHINKFKDFLHLQETEEYLRDFYDSK